MTEHRSGLSFEAMALLFKIRDLITPRENILKELPLKEGMTVLDYGCGPGGYILPTFRIIGEEGTYNAADINPRAGMHAERIAKKNGYCNLNFINTDCDTGLRSSSMDIVYLFDIYHQLPERERNLKELKRVLKKTGLLAVSDHHLKMAGIENDKFLLKHFTIYRKNKNTMVFKKK